MKRILDVPHWNENMNIRLRLTLLFAVLVASIMLAFSLSVYYLYNQFREQEFNKRLRDKALTTVRLFEDVGGITEELLHDIERNDLTTMYKEEVTVYDSNNKVVYDSRKEPYIITPQLLAQAREGIDFSLRDGEKEIIGVRYVDKRKQVLVVVAYAIDVYGFSKLERLRNILITGWAVSLLLVILAGWLFASDALRPVSDIIEQVKNISARNIHERLKARRHKDELGQLVATFNDLLSRLEEAFSSQRNFVSHASHELRTPLTIMMGQLEVALLQKRTVEDYQQTIKEAIEEVKKMRDLINGLLELARINNDIFQLHFRPLNIDDLLWQVRESLLIQFPSYNIQIEFDESQEEETEFKIKGDKSLLQMAFQNIMENACKYSEDQRVNVSLLAHSDTIRISFTDRGIGISEEDLPHIFEPFYRGDSSKSRKGHGIGLALTQRIIQLHNGSIRAFSQLGKGTRFVISLPL
ncbi:HAMP domain-containing protein [Runella sp. CRIBMP]|uniref:sensor histidine kinase n=1 Tax=Runella sp. CRIBMP TaxID=2683261 RepID=UPI001411DF7D|nr:ATP-binding protein [Runella sp. CRIBMP]NBB22747.1 HAMP domain-containing protein [Runella sp. CRIBMP]